LIGYNKNRRTKVLFNLILAKEKGVRKNTPQATVIVYLKYDSWEDKN
jgi:hypothetical protein